MKCTFATCAVLILILNGSVLPAESKKDHGRDLFQEKGCSYCHSIGGVGGIKGPALDGVGKRHTKEAIENQIRNGSMIMPAFGEVLTPPEVDALAEFLHKSITVPAAVRQP